jgi:hypothetical protein
LQHGKVYEVSIEFSLLTKLKKNCRKRKQRGGEGKMSKKERERLDTTINVKKINKNKPVTVSLHSL